MKNFLLTCILLVLLGIAAMCYEMRQSELKISCQKQSLMYYRGHCF